MNPAARAMACWMRELCSMPTASGKKYSFIGQKDDKKKNESYPIFWFMAYQVTIYVMLTAMAITFAVLSYQHATGGQRGGSIFIGLAAISSLAALYSIWLFGCGCRRGMSCCSATEEKEKEIGAKLKSISDSPMASTTTDKRVFPPHRVAIGFMPGVLALASFMVAIQLYLPTTADVTDFYVGTSSNRTALLDSIHQMCYWEIVLGGIFLTFAMFASSVQVEPGWGLNHWMAGFGVACWAYSGTSQLLIRLYCFPETDDGFAHKDLIATHSIIISVMIVATGVILFVSNGRYVLVPYSTEVSEEFQKIASEGMLKKTDNNSPAAMTRSSSSFSAASVRPASSFKTMMPYEIQTEDT